MSVHPSVRLSYKFHTENMFNVLLKHSIEIKNLHTQHIEIAINMDINAKKVDPDGFMVAHKIPS